MNRSTGHDPHHPEPTHAHAGTGQATEQAGELMALPELGGTALAELAQLSLLDLARLLVARQTPAAPTATAVDYRPVPAPALPAHYQGMSVADCRQRLRTLQDEACHRASSGRLSTAESREWTAMPVHFRMAMILLAGLDGEIEDLAQRDWREMPPPERDAIRRQIRALRAALSQVPALAMRT
jgi:hypothetical protein